MVVYIEKPQLLERIAEDGHYAIEASAGTGKTFTIQKLFFDLMYRGVSPKEVLLTTFTRAATAELKKRLAEELDCAMALYREKRKEFRVPEDESRYWKIDAQAYHRLSQARAEIESCCISTLDSLFQRILREHSDLSQTYTDGQLKDMQSVKKMGFERFMNEVVPMQDILRACVFAYSEYENEKRTRLTSEEFYGDYKDYLKNDLERLDRERATVSRDLDYTLLKSIKGVATEDAFVKSYCQWYRAFCELSRGLKQKDFCSLFLEVLEKRKYSTEELSISLSVVAIYSHFIYSSHASDLWVWFSDRCFRMIASQRSSQKCTGESDDKRCSKKRVVKTEKLRQSLQALNQVLECHSIDLANEKAFSGIDLEVKRELWTCLLGCLIDGSHNKLHYLGAYAFPYYRMCLNDIKIERREFDYSDFTSNLMQSLEGEYGKTLIEAIGQEWRYAIVDEFQDTSYEQWEILRRCFLKEGHQLFVIGDPKQAIYGFRGSDIFIYRQALQDMKECNEMQLGKDKDFSYKLELTDNYRSTPAMVSSLNGLYSGCENAENEVENADSTQMFSSVKSLEKYDDAFTSEKVNRYSHVDAGRKTWRCVDLENGKEVPALEYTEVKDREKWAEEIIKIIDSDYASGRLGFYDSSFEKQFPDGRIPPDAVSKYLRPLKNIYVICQKRSDLEPLRTLLSEKGFEFEDAPERSEKIFGKQEACDLIRIMCAIDEPENHAYISAALNTMFFGLTVYQVGLVLRQSESRAKACFRKWHKWAQDRSRFKAIFADILRVTHFKSRLALYGKTEQPYWNVRRLMETISQRAVYEEMRWSDLVEWVKKLYLENTTYEDSFDGAEGIASKNGLKIQFQTIHGCKGLEAEVVFFLYSPKASVGKSKKSCIFHEKVTEKNSSQRWQRFMETQNVSDDLSPAILEDNLEKERLIYVALTRAKYRLHLPKYTGGGKMSFIAEKLNYAYENCNVMNGESESTVPDSLLDVYRSLHARRPSSESSPLESRRLSADLLNQLKAKIALYDGEEQAQAVEMTKDEAASRVRYNHSYSELKRQEARVDSDDCFYREKPPILVQQRTSVLPKGTNTGLFLHEVFEKIDFSHMQTIYERFHGEFCSFTGTVFEAYEKKCLEWFNRGNECEAVEEVNCLFEQLATKYKLLDNKAAVCEAKRIVYRTLTSRNHRFLPDLEFALCDADEHISEMSFLSDCDGIEGVTGNYHPEFDMFNGSIDCCCKFGDVWYIIDWKSDSLPQYDEEYLRGHIDEAYGNQRAIYMSVFKKWLSRMSDEFEFAGMIYIFLRGVEENGDSGFCFFESEI